MLHGRFIASFLLLLCAFSPARAEDPSYARIASASGQIWAMQGGKKRSVRAGDRLIAREKVVTETGASAQIKIGRTVVIALRPETEIELVSVKAGKDQDYQANLARGAVLASVSHPKKRPNHFVIKTRATALGVRGTTFFVESRPEAPVQLCTCEGTVQIRSAVSGKVLESITARHHDAPRKIENDRAVGIGAPEVGAHSDEEIAQLKSLLR